MFNDFFNYYRVNNPYHVAFSLFDARHIGMLAVLILGIQLTCVHYKNLDEKKRDQMRKIMAIGMVTIHVFRQFSFVLMQGMPWLSMININLCPIMIWISLVHGFKPSKLTGNLLYGIGLPGFFLALFFPDWTMLPFFNFYGLEQWLMHGLLAAFIIMQVSVGEVKPKFNDLWRVMGITLAFMPVVYVVNLHLGTNFWFLSAGSQGSPLDLLIAVFGAPWFVIPYTIIFALMVTSLYIPWYVSEKIRSTVLIDLKRRVKNS